MAKKAQTQALPTEVEELKAKIEALEEIVAKAMPPTPTTTPKEVAPKLRGEIFQVGKAKYRCVYPAFDFEGASVTEDDVLTSPDMQIRLVEGGYGVIEQV